MSFGEKRKGEKFVVRIKLHHFSLTDKGKLIFFIFFLISQHFLFILYPQFLLHLQELFKFTASILKYFVCGET